MSGEAKAETLVMIQFLKGNWVRIRTNNPLERILREIGRRIQFDSSGLASASIMHIPTILFRLFTRISGQAIAQAFTLPYFSREFFPSVFFIMDAALAKYIWDLGKLIRLDTETAPSNNRQLPSPTAATGHFITHLVVS